MIATLCQFLDAHPRILSFGLCFLFIGSIFAVFAMGLSLESKQIGKSFDDEETKL